MNSLGFLPQLRDVESLGVLLNKSAPPGGMSPLYELILQRKGELQTETVQVVDAAQAWRLGRERYPHCIRGVVRRDAGRDGSAAEPSKRR